MNSAMPMNGSNGSGRYGIGRVLKVMGSRVHRAQLPRMAAALTYRTIFALIPMLVIGVAVIGTLADKDTVETAIDRIFELTGIDRIVLNPTDPQAPFMVGPQLPAEISGESLLDRTRIDIWIDGLVSGVEGAQGRLKAVGAVGVAVLFYASLGFLIEIERAFNSIYHARDGRAWSRRFTNYTTILVIGPIFLILTFWLGGQVSAVLERLADWLNLEATLLTSLIVRGVGVCMSMLLLVLLYRVIPNARVHVRAAATGAFIAALLFELAKFGLVMYLSSFSGGVERLYGAIGLIPIFLLWVYVTWTIVLFGLQCAFLLQHRRDVLADNPGREWRVVDPAAALLIATEAARRFTKGTTISASHAAKAAGIDEDLAIEMLDGMVSRGVLHAVEPDDDAPTDRYALANTPESIPATQALDAGFGLVGLATGMTREMREAQVKALGRRTLADLVAEGHGRNKV